MRVYITNNEGEPDYNNLLIETADNGFDFTKEEKEQAP